MEKQGFNGKNEEPFIPEGLEYRDEHWQKALEGIIRHEKRTDRRRRAWIFSVVGLLLLSGTIAVLSQFTAPEEATNPAPSNESGISVNPESTTSSQPEGETHPLATYSSETNTPNNAYPSVSSESSVGQTKSTLANEVKSDITVLKTPTPKNHAVLDSLRLPVKSSQNNPDQAVLRSDPTESSTPRIIPDSKDQAKTSEGIFVPDVSILSNEVLPVQPQTDWDRSYLMPYRTRLQLPVPNHALQSPLTLDADRNWTEPTWRWWAYAGSSLVTDFSSPLRDIRIDPMAGMRFEYNFNKRYFIDGGVEYFAISNVRRPFSQTSIAYDLNYQRTVTTVETHQLHYLSMPFHMGYRLSRRHQLTLGFGVSYMITGTNEIFQYKQTPTSNTLINQYEDRGFVAGFKDFPIHSEIGYAYKLGRNKSIRFAYQFGLTDITKNDYFSSNSLDRNSRFLIDLSFKLKSK